MTRTALTRTVYPYSPMTRPGRTCLTDRNATPTSVNPYPEDSGPWKSMELTIAAEHKAYHAPHYGPGDMESGGATEYPSNAEMHADGWSYWCRRWVNADCWAPVYRAPCSDCGARGDCDCIRF